MVKKSPRIPGVGRPLQMRCHAVSSDNITGGNGAPIVFRLNPNQPGGCPDDERRNVQRVEGNVSSRLRNGALHHLRAKIHFHEGMIGSKETFCQIIGWTSSCKVGPSLQVMLDRGLVGTKVRPSVAPELYDGQTCSLRPRMPTKLHNLRVDRLMGRTVSLDIEVNRRQKTPTLTVVLDNKVLLRNYTTFLHPRAQYYMRLGLYRPTAGHSSVISLHDLRQI